MDEAAFDAHMRINTRGCFLGSKHAVQQMKKQEPHVSSGLRGWIVNFASMVANIGMAGLSKLRVITTRSRFLFFDDSNICSQLATLPQKEPSLP